MATINVQQRIDQARADYQAFARGDIASVMARFADDIVWHIAGEGDLTGDYRGKQAVTEFLGNLAQRTGGTYKLQVHDILASQDHVVVLAEESAERNGQRYTGSVVHVSHSNDQNQVTEFWAIPEDQAAANRFFS